jgi:high-affinity iron transporter
MKRSLIGHLHLLAVSYALLSAAAHAAEIEHGKIIYGTRCAFCHGTTGKGDGPAGAALKPPPTNFTEPTYWKTHQPETVKAAIENGIPNTAMLSFKTGLSLADIDDVVAYLKTLAPSQ